MSNTTDCIMGGISITWKVEKFSSIPKCWRTSFPMDWATTKSKWKFQILFDTTVNRSLVEINKKGIAIIFDKLDDIAPFSFCGTVFAVNENISFLLSSIDGYNFRKKRTWLTPFKEIDWKQEGLIKEDCITLRINLWDPTINDLIGAEYFICSTCVQQICLFQWSIKDYLDWKKDGEYYESSTEIPMEFIDFENLQPFRMKICLQVIDRNIFPIIKAKEINKRNFRIRGSYELEIEREDGSNLHLLDKTWKQYHFDSYMGDRMRDTDGLGPFVTSKCVVKIEMLFVTDSRGIIEKICYESNLQKLSNKSETSKKKQLSKDNLQYSMQTLFEEGKFCDVMLRATNETLHCHKAVLCARSSVFQTMFEKDMIEKETNVVNIEDVEPQILRIFLNYLYTDNIGEAIFGPVVKLYAVADKYAVLSLQEKCADIILSCLSVDNVCEALDLADSHQDDYLKKEILVYFCEHSKEIVGSSSWKSLFISKPLLAAETLQAVVTNTCS